MNFQNSYRGENKDKMYEYYHHYFMDFYDNFTKPTKNDVLKVNTTLPDPDKTVLTSKVKYFNAKKNKYYDFIDPKF